MEKHLELTDREFENAFAHCKLNPSLFSHEAHLRLAWIHINQYGLEQAERHITDQLKAYVISLGAKEKYNATLTVAAIKMVYHFMGKSHINNFIDFIIAFPILKSHFKELLQCHYGFDIFNSPIAKKQFLKPDLLPFE